MPPHPRHLHSPLFPSLPPLFSPPGSPFSHYTHGWAGTRFSVHTHPPNPPQSYTSNKNNKCSVFSIKEGVCFLCDPLLNRLNIHIFPQIRPSCRWATWRLEAAPTVFLFHHPSRLNRLLWSGWRQLWPQKDFHCGLPLPHPLKVFSRTR